MQIQFKIKFFDVYLYHCIHSLYSLPQHLSHVVVCAILTSIVGDVAASPQGVESVDVPIAMAIAAVATYLALLAFQCVLVLYSLVTVNIKNALGARTLEVRDAGLFEDCKSMQLLMYWKGLYKIVERPGYCAIYVNSIQFIVIPHRKFSSQQERIRFVATIRDKIAAARTQGTNP